jgi:hypothetical protein
MAGAIENREKGAVGGQVILDIIFRKYEGGSKTDDDNYLIDGTLPRVRIYNPQGTVVADSSLPGALQPVRNDTGMYDYVYPIPLDAEISDQWKIKWSIVINSSSFEPEELFAVVSPGDAEFDESEFRIGFAFNNPDLTSTHHGSVNVNGTVQGWGLLVAPDELRYMVGFGTKLVSPDAAQTYDNNMLQWYIDVAIASLERDLNIDLIPRVVRHADPVDQSVITNVGSADPLVGSADDIKTEGDYKARQDLPSEADEPNRVREDPYPYRPNPDNNFGYIKLKRRPLREVLKAVLTDPQQNGMVDIYNWRKEKKGFASAVQFYPPVSAIQSLYIANSTEFFARQGLGWVDYPAATWIDYTTGFVNAADVPIDFRGVIMWLAGIMLLDDFGDGKSPGLAGASVNLNSISESFQTTQSASITPECRVSIKHNKNQKSLTKPIGELFSLYKSGNLDITQYKVKSINPKDITDIQYKQLLDVVEHHVPKKQCFRVEFENNNSVGITEDHSLFVIDNGSLHEIKGSDLVVGSRASRIAVIVNNKVSELKVKQILPIKPKNDLVYDLSVQDFENFITNNEIIAHNTNALYGARRANYVKNFKDWYSKNKNKYQRAMIGAL